MKYCEARIVQDRGTATPSEDYSTCSPGRGSDVAKHDYMYRHEHTSLPYTRNTLFSAKQARHRCCLTTVIRLELNYFPASATTLIRVSRTDINERPRTRGDYSLVLLGPSNTGRYQR